VKISEEQGEDLFENFSAQKLRFKDSTPGRRVRRSGRSERFARCVAEGAVVAVLVLRVSVHHSQSLLSRYAQLRPIARLEAAPTSVLPGALQKPEILYFVKFVNL
jgi:hypothetical protein